MGNQTFKKQKEENLLTKKIRKEDICVKLEVSPYSSKLIVKYLKKRSQREQLNNDSYLFSKMMDTGKIGIQGFMDIFSKINEKLYKDDLVWSKEQLTLGKISEEKYKEEINNISKFHAHGLRSFFINTISSHCGNLKIVTSMEGHKSPVDTDSSYTKFDRGVVLNHYFPLIPYLSFEKAVVNQIDDKGHKQ